MVTMVNFVIYICHNFLNLQKERLPCENGRGHRQGREKEEGRIWAKSDGS